MLYANGYPVGGGGGGTGGHTIIDENGNSMTARAGLQFVGGANVSDDATNNKTIVDISGGGGGFGLVQSGHTVYTLTGQNLETRVPITFDTPFPEVPNVALSLSDPSRGQYYDPQTGLGVMNLTKNGFEIMIKSSNQAVAGDITIYWIATTKFSGNGIFHPTIYSFEERVIGVWTDGKPLYSKIVEIQSFSSSSPISIDVSSLNVDTMVEVTGEAYVISNNVIVETLYFPVYNFASSYTAQIRFLTNNIQIYHERLNDYTSGILKILYTKTTDVAGSGSWTPQGVPAVHYSTDEHIVGTWIDGSTIYEKTIPIQKSSISSGNNTINHLINNFGQLVKKEIIYNYSNGDTNTDLANPSNNDYRMEVGDVGSTDFTLFIGTSAFSLISVIYATLRYTKSS